MVRLQVNWSAVVFSSVVSDEDAVFGTEVQFLIDDQGGVYVLFQSKFLSVFHHVGVGCARKRNRFMDEDVSIVN